MIHSIFIATWRSKILIYNNIVLTAPGASRDNTDPYTIKYDFIIFYYIKRGTTKRRSTLLSY